MRDIPMFCTDLGVASLILKKIPYTKEAYIHFRDTDRIDAFLKECCDFCIAAGAEYVYATGDDRLACYPVYTSIVKMQCSTESIRYSDAMLFPVQEKTLNTWREIYNQRMLTVPGASYMTIRDAEKRFCNGGLYFVHQHGRVLGIGAVSWNNIDVVASVVPGAGETVVSSLCSLIANDIVTLRVATNNVPAVSLYKRMGFLTMEELECWYKII